MWPGLQLEPKATPSFSRRSVGLLVPIFLDQLCSVSAALLRLFLGGSGKEAGHIDAAGIGCVQCQPSLVCRESRAGGKEGGQGRVFL